jgi:hypothetical protein
MIEKMPAFRQRRAADTARWRERLRRGAAVYPLEADAATFDLMERFAGLNVGQMDDRRAVSAAPELTSRCVGKACILALQLRRWVNDYVCCQSQGTTAETPPLVQTRSRSRREHKPQQTRGPGL